MDPLRIDVSFAFLPYNNNIIAICALAPNQEPRFPVINAQRHVWYCMLSQTSEDRNMSEECAVDIQHDDLRNEL